MEIEEMLDEILRHLSQQEFRFMDGRKEPRDSTAFILMAEKRGVRLTEDEVLNLMKKLVKDQYAIRLDSDSCAYRITIDGRLFIRSDGYSGALSRLVAENNRLVNLENHQVRPPQSDDEPNISFSRCRWDSLPLVRGGIMEVCLLLLFFAVKKFRIFLKMFMG